MNSLWSNYNENVKSKPDKVIFKEATSGKEIKFKELEIESEKVADYIEANSVKFGKYVGVSSSKKINSVVTMIGVMKTGRAYIPIDDRMPQERKAYILSQCDNSYCSYDEAMSVDVPHVERNIEAIGMDESAYIIYTSGSTGTPKGVEISYSSVINTVLSVNDNFSVDSNDVLINLAPFDFDLSVYDIINALMIGSKLVITQDGRDIELIREMLINEKITVWNSVPMVMEMLITYLQFKYPNEEIPSMKNIFLSGDKTYVKLAHKMKKVFPNTEVVSMGGATECAIWSNYFKFSELVTAEEIIPYGYALDNQTLMVLDENLQKCEPGEEGEIIIGGQGVAKGYYKDLEKTNRSFVNTDEFGRVYKTGDKGVLTEHGYINFLGRFDRQRKVRGYRIELEEIENALEDITGLRCAVGIVNDSIVAKVVNESKIKIKDIESKLKTKLPHYMCPSKIDFVDSIPVTKNGKVDYKLIFCNEE